MEKQYHNLSDTEKFIIREYDAWKVATIPTALKFEMLSYWRLRAEKNEISHLL